MTGLQGAVGFGGGCTWEDDAATVGEQGAFEGNGGVEILTNVEVAVVERCSSYLNEDLICFRDRCRNGLEGEGVVAIIALDDSDCFGHFQAKLLRGDTSGILYKLGCELAQ